MYQCVRLLKQICFKMPVKFQLNDLCLLMQHTTVYPRERLQRNCPDLSTGFLNKIRNFFKVVRLSCEVLLI